MIDRITPVILTFNESPNIARTLEKLTWAADVVVVDSHSTDDTLERARAFPRARTFERTFDEHAAQWNWAVGETGIETEWVLALDADYLLTDELIEELRGLDPAPDVARLSGLVRLLRLRTPPARVGLSRRSPCSTAATARATCRTVTPSGSRSTGRSWISRRRSCTTTASRSPRGYGPRTGTCGSRPGWSAPRPGTELRWPDRLRKLRVVAPFLVFALLPRGSRAVCSTGWAGWFYAFQRMIAETILSLHLLGSDLGIRED